MIDAVLEAAPRALELERILAQGLVRSVYQPIVDLDTGEVVAYEALARGPEGSPLERPDLLFAAAREAGSVAELDWACRAAAGLLERAGRELDVVLELTERCLTDRPAEMLARVARMRELGCAIALDDVGADRRSLALMPFVAPEVIKLDMRLVQERPGPATAAVVHAVNAESERSGAVLLGEGIETPGQRDVAMALGAATAIPHSPEETAHPPLTPRRRLGEGPPHDPRPRPPRPAR